MRTVLPIAIAAFLATFVGGTLLTSRPDGESAAAGPTVVAAPRELARQPEETISIPTLGLSVVRPPGWSVITAEENAQNLRSVEMDDRELQELAVRYANAPLVAFSKYKEPYADLNPSFKINVRPLGGFGGHAPEEIMQAALPTMRRLFNDMVVAEGPKRTTVAGKPAAYTRLAYTMRAGDLAFPTVSEIWIVPSGPVYFMIGTGTRADERNGTRAEARAIVDSLTIK